MSHRIEGKLPPSEGQLNLTYTNITPNIDSCVGFSEIGLVAAIVDFLINHFY